MDKYINDIYKNLKLPKSKKLEIKKQLSSDIQIALENGESIEGVISRMGNAKDIAEEFNSNITESEKKKLKKEKSFKIIGTFAVILVLLFFAIYMYLPKYYDINDSKVFNKNTIEENALKAANAFAVCDYDSLSALCNDKLKQYLFDNNNEGITSARNYIPADLGSVISVGNIYISELKQAGDYYAPTQFTITYQNRTVTYTFSFNSNMELCAFYVK